MIGDTYHAKRELFCVTNLIMNYNGKKAPAFRSGPKPRPKFGKEYADTDLSNDKQVIDLHWLFENNREGIDSSDGKIDELFAKDVFDFDLAGEIVSRKGDLKLKIKILGLTNEVQMGLSMIRSSEVLS